MTACAGLTIHSKTQSLCERGVCVAKVKLDFGAEVDFLTKGELGEALREADAEKVSWLQAVKWMRLPETLTGTASSSKLTLGETTGQICGPRLGYSWVIKRLVVTGLTTGQNPDVVNFYRGTPSGPILWQLNGNSFGATFGRCEMTLVGGETLAVASVGTFASTSTIIVSGELIEVPTELMGRLA